MSSQATYLSVASSMLLTNYGLSRSGVKYVLLLKYVSGDAENKMVAKA